MIRRTELHCRLVIGLLDRNTAFRSFTSVDLSNVDPSSPLLQYYTVTPPIKPWPQNLHPKRLVSMINRQQNLDLALQIFLYAGKFHPNFFHNYNTYQSIIQKLSRARAFEPMESLISQLQNSQIKCGEELFITVIRNYGLASLPKLAVKTFLRIENFNVQRSVRSLNTLLNVLVQNKRYDLVHFMFKNSKTKFDVIPNVFTANILIKALCQKNDVEAACKVLDEMPEMGMVPNLVTYTTILGGYLARGDMRNGKRVFMELLDRGWIPDATTYTVLMDGYCKLGKFNEAVKVMDEMEENGVDPNEVTYGVMIQAFCKEKKSGEALNLFNDMLQKKYIPSSSLSCKVIDLLCEEGKVEEGCYLWKKMLKNDCLPDNAILSTLIHWLCKEGKVWEARKIFDEFEKGSVPSLLTYNTLINGMCEKGELSEAGKLWDDMVEKGCNPNVFTYNILITGFCKIGNTMEGVRILEEMLDKGCLPNKATYNILIEGLQDMGKEGEVGKVVSIAMSSGGVDPSSWDLFLTKIVGKLDDGVDFLDQLLLESAN
ncbi:Pentatricopeptide repeat-containing protein [Hibiscus syriacus]|uniref:Pentatricopeptide repeat-containing protein n=1 Tax=Hibiscus syriacus TaxID=106335 RepID=A0A6A2WZE2_HIBSY|nr:pentatricopeptide repeat-containing protein At5g16420, mitochondrial [Hibiscus syriacus]KAE8660525.1 Pentatricopeptide repeat-containing protein [Hibiscus syriacus]